VDTDIMLFATVVKYCQDNIKAIIHVWLYRARISLIIHTRTHRWHATDQRCHCRHPRRMDEQKCRIWMVYEERSFCCL